MTVLDKGGQGVSLLGKGRGHLSKDFRKLGELAIWRKKRPWKGHSAGACLADGGIAQRSLELEYSAQEGALGPEVREIISGCVIGYLPGMPITPASLVYTRHM